MTASTPRRRVEVLADRPLIRRVCEAAERAGVTGWTLLPCIGGSGSHGRWREDELTGAATKIMFLTITDAPRADALVAALEPLLDSHGLMLVVSAVEVVRGAKF